MILNMKLIWIILVVLTLDKCRGDQEDTLAKVMEDLESLKKVHLNCECKCSNLD